MDLLSFGITGPLLWWVYVLVVLGLTHVTIAAVTLYLHRSATHGAVQLHPVVSHFFRAWLWATTGMITKAWVAIHRKHHARVETIEDPHSPQVLGLWTVLSRGSELYRAEAANQETLDKYGHGTPDDWVERHLYSTHPYWGVVLMFIVDIALFGPIGLTMAAVQMMWIPINAAGIINGVGHKWGYRSFTPADGSKATNIVPWGILIGGEELHNNHHMYATSPKFSVRWWEFDLGWAYIQALRVLGLATLRRPTAG